MSDIDRIEPLAGAAGAEVAPRSANGSAARHQAAPVRDERPPIADVPVGIPSARAPAPDLDPPAGTVAPAVPRRRRPSLRTLLMAGGIAVVALGSGIAWLRGGRYASTDDAYVQAAKLMVSTDVSGIVTSVDVHEGQLVKAGDVLFRIDPRQFQIALDNAKANLAQTSLTIESMKQDYQRMLSDIATEQAQVALDQATYDRYATLVRSDSISRANYDQARFTLAADTSKVESLKQQAQVQLAKLAGNAEIPVDQHPQYLQARAQVDEAQRQLDHAVVRAPFDGTVTQVDTLQPGTFLVSQTAALTNTGAVGLVSANKVWVDANMKETDLTYVKPGEHVDVTVDTYPGRTWSGTVESISPASGAQFSILPAQNSSGNWVKVVQRITVRIRVDRKPGDPLLRAGMSVNIDIDTGHRRSLSELL
jgi:membrane fusion protein (multidrug efflux system)